MPPHEFMQLTKQFLNNEKQNLGLSSGEPETEKQ